MGVKEISPLKQPPLPPTGKGADLNSGFTSMKKKKRGAGKSAQRANAWRNAKHRYGLQQQHHRKQRGMSKLSYTETVEIIDKRQRKFEEPSQKEVEDMIDDDEAQIDEEAEREEERDYQRSVAKDKSPTYGNLRVEHKPEDTMRFLSVNINGLAFWWHNNPKADHLKFILKHYQIDGLGLQEPCINWCAFKSSITLASLLRDGTTPIKSVHSHNLHETDNIGRKQRGGTATLLRDELAARVIDRGWDETRLGRWSWYRIQGEPGWRTRIVTAYAPTGNKQSDFGSYYKQIQRYIQKKGLRTNPKAMFREDLCRELRHWRSLGDQVLLMMDANENVLEGAMVKKMAKPDIGLRAAVHSQVPGHGPKTHIRGSQSIDEIFVTPGLVVVGASYLPFCEDLGDHRQPAADITVDSLLGRKLPRIAPPKARKLNSKSGKSCAEYIRLLEESTDECKLYDRLLVIAGQKEPDSVAEFMCEQAEEALEKIDKVLTMLMLEAEKKCRKLYAAHYEFSPPVVCWLDRCHAYQNLPFGESKT